jgi:hypothetical protein
MFGISVRDSKDTVTKLLGPPLKATSDPMNQANEVLLYPDENLKTSGTAGSTNMAVVVNSGIVKRITASGATIGPVSLNMSDTPTTIRDKLSGVGLEEPEVLYQDHHLSAKKKDQGDSTWRYRLNGGVFSVLFVRGTAWCYIAEQN